MAANTAVAVPSSAKPPAKLDRPTELAKKLEASFASALPTHVTKAAFARALLTAFRRNPKLVDCTPLSVSSAVLTAAQLGLTIDVNGACWLIPFGKECTLVIGYQGMVDLCYRSGRVESIFADVVCKHDDFHFVQGLNQRLDHTPCMDGPRGDPYAVYALASIKDSSQPVFVVLTKDEVMKVKNASPAARKSDSPWNGPFANEMWKKTAIRRLAKMLPKSVELMEALDFEGRQEERWADITVEAEVQDDPFAEGRNRLPPRRQTPASPAPAEKDADELFDPLLRENFLSAWEKLKTLYDLREREIDAALSRLCGVESLLDVKNDASEEVMRAVIDVAKEM